VLFALVYLLLRRVVRLVIGSSNELMSTEVEVVVLRHQLMVLQRQVQRPRLRRRDRLSMAALSEALPELGGRRSWSAPRRSFAGTGSW
jgi:putative transposase